MILILGLNAINVLLGEKPSLISNKMLSFLAKMLEKNVIKNRK